MKKINILRSFFMLASALLMACAYAVPQCVNQGQTCIDATPCKTFSGVSVCLAQLGATCWDYKTTYNCDTLQIDTCSTLAAQGCTQTNSTCAQTDPTTGQCMLYNQTYTCQTTVTNQNTSCTGIPVNCVLQSSSCITTSAAGTQTAGQCTATSKIYQCPQPSTTSTTVTNCGGQTYCQGLTCNNVSTQDQTNSFNKTVAAMELARQEANYINPATMKVFDGSDKRCTVQLWTLGLAGDCCKVTGGAQSNSQIANMIIGSGIKQGFAAAGVTVANPSAAGSLLTQAVNLGSAAVGTYATGIYNNASSYVYDVFSSGASMTKNFVGGAQTLFTGANVTAQAATSAAAPAISSATQVAATTPTTAFSNFSYYGLTISTAAPAAGSIGLGSLGSFQFSFDPWSFAAAVALQVIMEALQCTQPEQQLMQQRGANLCHLIGTYCSNQLDLLVATICLEDTETYCCYNSKLALIINEQGRPQIGKSWGSPQAPVCSGYTMTELKSLDFSKMDLSAFISDLTKKLPNAAQIQAGVKAKMSIMYNNAPPF